MTFFESHGPRHKVGAPLDEVARHKRRKKPKRRCKGDPWYVKQVVRSIDKESRGEEGKIVANSEREDGHEEEQPWAAGLTQRWCIERGLATQNRPLQRALKYQTLVFMRRNTKEHFSSCPEPGAERGRQLPWCGARGSCGSRQGDRCRRARGSRRRHVDGQGR